jgi:hypothetical protein
MACPNCGAFVNDGAVFQWGYCHGSAPWSYQEQYQYKVGDPVLWKQCVDGSIPAWACWPEPMRTDWSKVYAGGCNVGDPDVKGVLVTDWYMYPEPFQCPSCGVLLGSTVVEIRDGVIVSARVFPCGEFDQSVNTYAMNENGRFEAKPEWDDHAVSHITCDAGTLRTAALYNDDVSR